MKNSIKNLAIRSVLSNYLGRACSIGIMFFLTPFLVSTLGDQRYRIWAMMMSLTGYYAVADLGIRSSGTKHIAAAHAHGDHRKINEIIVTALGIYSVMAVVVLGVVAIVAWLFPFALKGAEESLNIIRLVLLLTGLSFAISLLGQPFESVLAAYARLDVANIIAVFAGRQSRRPGSSSSLRYWTRGNGCRDTNCRDLKPVAAFAQRSPLVSGLVFVV